MKEDKRGALTRAPLMASLRGLVFVPCQRRKHHLLPSSSIRGFLASACPSSQSTPAPATPSTHPPTRWFGDYGLSPAFASGSLRSARTAFSSLEGFKSTCGGVADGEGLVAWGDLSNGSNCVLHPSEKFQAPDGGVADGEGFEPSVHCCTHAFQACAFDHSATHPEKNV